ncbi:hypothetical protein PspLS_02802 [Pyricularia sp. CBS 133598]|nr:hypothetical protein PspLS_02802 [Pyricularia sp. CBS 133598]
MVRIKERYLLVNILYPEALKHVKPNEPDLAVLHKPTTNDLTPQAILRAIREQVRILFGDYGSGLIERNLLVKYLSNATSTFILRVHREQYRLVWAALTFMDDLPIKNGQACTFRVVHVGGTMRKVETAAIRRHKALKLAVEKQIAGKESDVLDMLFGSSDSAQRMQGVVLDPEDDDGSGGEGDEGEDEDDS